MEGSGEKLDKKQSKREMKASSKTSTLPPGAMLGAHQGEGFFSKIRRCLRLRGKGKYDFNHGLRPANEGNGSMPLASSNSRPSSSPVLGEHSGNSPNTRPSPLKATRRSKCDKEEVLLIRRDKRSSGGPGITSRAVDGGREDVLVVTVEDYRSTSKSEGAGVMSRDVENKENDEVFEELDPDYETLDDIRRKVQSHAENGTDVPAAQSTVTSVGQVEKAASRKPVQVKMKTSSDLSGLDSGLGSPFTDSPGSSRESQAHSVTSSVFSSSLLSCNNPELPRAPLQVLPTAVCIDSAFPETPDADPMITSTTSQCSNSSMLEEDDLYSNAKVLIRKKSQRQSQSQTSLSTLDQRSNGVYVDQSWSARNSLSPADFLAMIEAECPEPLAPPPLPARNYSEEDINARVDRTPSSSHSFASDLKINSSGHEDSRRSWNTLFNGTGARPKTSMCSVHSASSEHIPPIAMSSSPGIRVIDSDVLLGSLSHSLPYESPDSLTHFDNIYEDIPDRFTVNASLKDDYRPNNDDLTHTDEDTAMDSEHQSERAESTDLPEDIMIVSASDSCCGNDTDDSLDNQLCSPAEDTGIHFPVEQSDIAGQGAAAAVLSSFREGGDMRYNTDRQSGSAEEAALCLQSDAKGNLYTNKDLTPSSSRPLSASSSSSLSTSSPSPVSSSDTLNNMMDDADADPDDFEGKDESPPVGPAIHISHQQLLRRLNVGDDGGVFLQQSHGSGFSAGARNARPMEISGSRYTEHDDEDSSGASSIHRHSVSIPPGPAHSHKDFLESMKQLKDCGWYWGPLSYEEAESKLLDKRDGSFLVRDSSNENYILSLSFKSMGQVHHTRIEHHKGLFSFWSQPDSHGKAQICQFIEQTVENSKNGRFLYFLRPAGPGSPPLPIQLLYPVSRFFRVPSLQHMCRFLVLRRVRRDHIELLPVPQKVKGYLLEKQYYVETLDED